jgi:hypothetical protein
LTWQIDPRNNFTATLIGDPTQNSGVGSFPPDWTFENPDPYLREIETGGYNLALRGTHILRENVILESFISGITRTYRDLPATQRGREEDVFIDHLNGVVVSGGSRSDTDNESTQVTLGVKATWLTGRHEVRAGLTYRDNKLDRDTDFYSLDRLGLPPFRTWWASYQGTVRNRIPSLFVQDAWRPGERWTLNLGLRWDGQDLIGSDGDVAQRITDQYQPRVGFVYLPGKIGSQRLYGSAGRFYHDLTTHLSSVAHLGGGSEGACIFFHDPRVDPTGCIPIYLVEDLVFDEIHGIRGQYFDEFAIGYERALGARGKLGARVVYRKLGEAIVTGTPADWGPANLGEFVWGNPGRGDMSHFPEARRDYKALELTWTGQAGSRFSFLTSYVWSRNEGNYTGLFDSDYERFSPNTNPSFKTPDLLVDADGLLPNDRTHVFKFSGAYRFDMGLNLGTFVTWQSGTPLNELGAVGQPADSLGFHGFVQPRGTVGRTPSIFDLNLRLTYDLVLGAASKQNARFFLDVFHLISDREPVNFDQVHYRNLDDEGNQTNPNPLYGAPTRYHLPTAVRLCLQFGF